MKTRKNVAIGRTAFVLSLLLMASFCGVAKGAEAQNADNSQKSESAAKTLEPTPFDAPPADFDKRQDGVRYGDVREATYFSTTTETERKIFVILPPGYDDPSAAEKTYPVLFLLHGIGGDEREWFGGAPVEILGNLLARGEAREMIVVLPNGRARHKSVQKPPRVISPEGFREFDVFLDEMRDNLKPFVEKTYRCKTGRENWAVAGLSMGGRSALHIGLTEIDEFAWIGAFEPAPGVLGFWNIGGLFKTKELTVPEKYKNATKIDVTEGTRDDVVGDSPRKYAKTLTENGDSPRYFVIEGGHDFGVWKTSLYLFAKQVFQD